MTRGSHTTSELRGTADYSNISTISNKKPPLLSDPGKQGGFLFGGPNTPKKSRPSGANETLILPFLNVLANFRKIIQKFMSGKQGGFLFEIILIASATRKQR